MSQHLTKYSIKKLALQLVPSKQLGTQLGSSAGLEIVLKNSLDLCTRPLLQSLNFVGMIVKEISLSQDALYIALILAIISKYTY
jgi:hypothetical protein